MKRKSLLSNPEYLKFCQRYRHKLEQYCFEVVDMNPTWQQRQVIRSIEKPGCRVAVSSGHGTGKSRVYAAVCDWMLRVYPYSNTLLTATGIDQVRSVVWKELDDLKRVVDRRFPEMEKYFLKFAKRYYQRDAKDSWWVMAKTAPKDKPEAIAGQHRQWYTILVDEASGVDDKILEVLRGGLTNEENRFVMVSQPTRPVGHFSEAMKNLHDIYKSFTLNSEESPLVSDQFIMEKLIEYGGHHSPEYQIRVLGNFPDNFSGFLIPRPWCDDAQIIQVIHPEGSWGWVMTIDVGEGVYRDSSVWTISKVSGYEDERIIEVVDTYETNQRDPKVFGRMAYVRSQEYQYITIAIDSDGPGLTTALEIEELGGNVVRIHWGRPPHADAAKKRYQDQRAYACVMARKAIFEKRFRFGPGRKIVEQASKIPYSIDRRGRYVITPKDQMRTQGIKSPDIFDAYCFIFLCDYIPADESNFAMGGDNEMLKWAQEILEGGMQEAA